MPNGQRPQFRIEGQKLGTFIRALQTAYNPGRFDQMMEVHLSRRRFDYTLANDMPQRYFDVITAANMEGWTADLLSSALDAVPGNRDLQAFARQLGLNPIPDDEASNLQKVVNPRSVYRDAEPFLDVFASCISRTCQVAVPGSGGTGSLIADDLVLTNHHVIARAIGNPVALQAVTCIFDHKVLKSGIEISPGRKVPLHASGVVASRKHSAEDIKREGGEPGPQELDYALLRLAEPVGREPQGTKGPNDPAGTPRGYIRLSANAPKLDNPGDPIVVLQHPQPPGMAAQLPIQLSIGTTEESPYPDRRIRHNARSHPGSSGSPVFSADLTMAALHHASDPVSRWQPALWNQAIPIRAILADLATLDLAALGIAKFWDD
jgi:Trypsin-like peptidase domain/Effector-associated domain 1